MKKALGSHSMVAHVWAQQSQSEGYASRMHFTHETIYSYGEHFPMAVFVTNDAGETVCAVNTDHYSSSTGKHQSHVRRAISGPTMPVNTATAKALSSWMASKRHRADVGLAKGEARKWQREHDKRLAATLNSEARYAIVSAVEAAEARRIHRKKAEEIENGLKSFDTLQRIAGFAGVTLSKEVLALGEKLRDNSADVLVEHRKQQAAEAKKRDKAQKAEQLRRERVAAEAAPVWLAHEDTSEHRSALFNVKDVLLRVVAGGEEIETSHGARFPVEHARKAFIMVRACKERGKAYERGKKSIHLGHFAINSVTAEGDVTAGCHHVKWAAIEHAARVLKIYP